MDERIPPYLYSELLKQYGAETVDRILAGFACRRPVTLRLNPLRPLKGGGDIRAAIADAGIEVRPVPWYDDALILEHVREDAVRALPLYADGSVYLQGLSAMLPALVLDPKAGESVLDMCAAPGGKTTQLAALSGNGAMITACERDRVRAERLRYNLEKQGCTRVTVLTADASKLDDMFRFDRILLDAPCTGSGTVDLTPGSPARRMESGWVQKTVRAQRALLRKAMRLLAPGGTLVYATCSVLEAENEGAVREALASGMEPVPLPETLLRAVPALPVSIPGTLCVLPDELYEGFYISCLRKPR